MTDLEFIVYCETHCETPKALFVGAHVNRLLNLAGNPPEYARVADDQWFCLRADLALPLCVLSRERLQSIAEVDILLPLPEVREATLQEWHDSTILDDNP